jgi:hypothetical protein
VLDQDDSAIYASALNRPPSNDMFSVVVVVYSEGVEDVFQLDVKKYLVCADDFRGEMRLEGFCRTVLMGRESDVESLRGLRKLVRRREERVEGCFEGNLGHVCNVFGRDVYTRLHCCL